MANQSSLQACLKSRDHSEPMTSLTGTSVARMHCSWLFESSSMLLSREANCDTDALIALLKQMT
jgi:hypothetical protein